MSTAPGPMPRTSEAPHYAVIFPPKRTDGGCGQVARAQRMVEPGATQDGFPGIESARGADGLGITVRFWRDKAASTARKRDVEH